MEPFRTVTGVVCPIDRNDVDTDQIIPAQFLKRIERTGFGEFLFWDRRGEEGFPLDDPGYAGAEILVAGENFGCGSSREHAPWAIQQAGFRVVVAPSFADIFRNNCAKNGLLTVTLPATAARRLMDAALSSPGARAKVDLEAQTVTLPDGTLVGFDIDASVRERLLGGLDDIALTLAEEDAIASYESDSERAGPATTALR